MVENELKVGDTVYGSFGRYSRVDVRKGTVVKVTPTGRVNVDFGCRTHCDGAAIIQQFKDGLEVGGDKWHPARLIDHARYEQMLAAQREEDAVNAFRVHASKAPRGSKAEMQVWVAEMQALLEAIPDSYGQ